MQATPLRLINAVLWPLTIWASLKNFGAHTADDYVERTSPIVATAIAFWIGVAAIIAVGLWSGGVLVFGDDGVEAVRHTRSSAISGVLWFFLPVIYLVGFWLYTTRDEAYPR